MFPLFAPLYFHCPSFYVSVVRAFMILLFTLSCFYCPYLHARVIYAIIMCCPRFYAYGPWAYSVQSAPQYCLVCALLEKYLILSIFYFSFMFVPYVFVVIFFLRYKECMHWRCNCLCLWSDCVCWRGYGICFSLCLMFLLCICVVMFLADERCWKEVEAENKEEALLRGNCSEVEQLRHFLRN